MPGMALVFGRRHLEQLLRLYTVHHNGRRPHRGLDLKTPVSRLDPLPGPGDGAWVRRHDVLGGVIREYELVA